MYYTNSKDGIERCTVRVEVRLTRAQVKKFRAIVRNENGKEPTEGQLKERIRRELLNGLDHFNMNFNDAGEYTGE